MKLLILFYICLSLQSSANISAAGSNSITYKVFKQTNKTYGYDIYSDGHRIIHQPAIPGRPGNSGFRKKNDARKIALLVVEKMTKKIMPPSVTLHEMDSLKVKY